MLGSLSVVNVESSAIVNGNMKVGGFVASMESIRDQVSTVSFDSCVSKGTVSGDRNVGGLIGHLYGNQKVNFIFLKCEHKGTITGNVNVGSFVGNLGTNTDTSVNITQCLNNGKVQGETVAGAFVSSAIWNTNINIMIQDSVNNGNINGSSKLGGFIGDLSSNINSDVTLYNCTNNGAINGIAGFCAGMVGFLSFDTETGSTKLVIQNCANKGMVSVSASDGCGMFCVGSSHAQCLTSHVLNSINKGELKSGANVYGVANIVSKADNFVSMGKLTATLHSFSFWNESSDTGRVYCLKNTCSKCDYATKFERKSSKNTYSVVDSGEDLYDLLTFQARKMRYGMVWTKDLELVYGEMPPAQSDVSSLPPPSGGIINYLSPFVVVLAFIMLFLL